MQLGEVRIVDVVGAAAVGEEGSAVGRAWVEEGCVREGLQPLRKVVAVAGVAMLVCVRVVQRWLWV